MNATRYQLQIQDYFIPFGESFHLIPSFVIYGGDIVRNDFKKMATKGHFPLLRAFDML